MITIHCELMNKDYQVKKVCKISEMPKNARFFNTAFFNKQSQDIYRTDGGIFYAKIQTREQQNLI
jgi:hypothetical protein